MTTRRFALALFVLLVVALAVTVVRASACRLFEPDAYVHHAACPSGLRCW